MKGEITMMRGFYGHDFWWMGITPMIINLIFWGVIIFVAVKMLNNYFSRVDASKSKEDSAMAILRERYAKGEIDEEEFKKKKSELE